MVEKVTYIMKLAASFCVGSFVIIWITSLLSPIILIASMKNGYYLISAIVMVLTTAAYLPWKKGVISRTLGSFYNKYHRCYYNECVIECEGDSITDFKKQTLYAVHPHGAFSFGWALLFCCPELKNVRFCFAPVLYASPFFRLFSRLVGNPGSASKDSMISYMKKGIDLALPPGGFEEATLSSLSQDRVFIKKRTGFIKLCLMHGISVRPVYVFGEKSLFWNIQGMWKLRLMLNRFGLPMIFVWGHLLFPLLPKSNKNIRVVIGAPIILPKILKPTKEDVRLWHGKYIAELTNLFEENKEKAYGQESKGTKLEIW